MFEKNIAVLQEVAVSVGKDSAVGQSVLELIDAIKKLGAKLDEQDVALGKVSAITESVI